MLSLVPTSLCPQGAPQPSRRRIGTTAHVCFSNEPCPMFTETSPCQAFATRYSSASRVKRGCGCFMPSLTDGCSERILKPPGSCFSPKSKGLWEPGEPKCLQMWKWAARLIPSPCEHCRGLESWKEPSAEGSPGLPGSSSPYSPASLQRGVDTTLAGGPQHSFCDGTQP